MLRNNKSRAAVSIMADQPTSSSKPNSFHCYSSKSLFTSPKFRFFSSKITPFDSDFSLVSPTSILEANPSILNPKPTSYLEPAIPNPHRFHPPDAFGLADLVKNRDHSRRPVNKMVLFGSKLRVQIPSADFGTKTGVRYPGHVSPCLQAKVSAVSEIDQTEEDYTRVVSHGPNPTITHIFDNSVFVEATTPGSVSSSPPPPGPVETNKTEDFLSHCYTCNKNLDHKQDIYIYRGEKGFCSSECRYQEMLLDQLET
uniref:FLZ-type domain-containing protein n=1 Tax=Noccaea caerulescens TaxID=107243 RepID=A0A1J3ILP1_NOCCA